MKKLNYSVSQLLNELQTFESISRLGKQLRFFNIADRPSSSRKRPAKKFAKKKIGAAKEKVEKQNLKVQKPNFKKARKLPKLKDAKEKCFYCQEQGHWKKNYPKYLKELKAKKSQGNKPPHFLHVLELNYIDNFTNS